MARSRSEKLISMKELLNEKVFFCSDSDDEDGQDSDNNESTPSNLQSDLNEDGMNRFSGEVDEAMQEEGYIDVETVQSKPDPCTAEEESSRHKSIDQPTSVQTLIDEAMQESDAEIVDVQSNPDPYPAEEEKKHMVEEQPLDQRFDLHRWFEQVRVDM